MVFVLVFFGGVLVTLVGIVLLILVFQLGFDLFPALYLNHVFVRQPQPTGFDVVEYDYVAVGAKYCLAGLVQCGNFTGQVIVGAGTVTQEATLPTPGRIHTASVQHRARGGTLSGFSFNGGDFFIVQVYSQQRPARAHQHVFSFRAGFLQLQVGAV